MTTPNYTARFLFGDSGTEIHIGIWARNWAEATEAAEHVAKKLGLKLDFVHEKED